MPFVRVSRDKRGYEQISLLHVSSRRGRPSKPRVLYVFRTPPGVKIGREPFDEAIQRELEAQNPGIAFDWKTLSNIPVPAPDVEFWRERRKADKAAKLARRADEQVEAEEGLESGQHPLPGAPDELSSVFEDPAGLPLGAVVSQDRHETGQADSMPRVVATGRDGVEERAPSQRRRQRRGNRGHRSGPPEFGAASREERPANPPPPAASGVEDAVEVPEASEDTSKLARDGSKEA